MTQPCAKGVLYSFCFCMFREKNLIKLQIPRGTYEAYGSCFLCNFVWRQSEFAFWALTSVDAFFICKSDYENAGGIK